MQRITIVADDETLDRLRELARERKVSLATVVREALQEKALSFRPRPASIGAGQSSPSHRRDPRFQAPAAAIVALILDTGPLYASLDRRDRDHGRCRLLVEDCEEALVIPSPVLPRVGLPRLGADGPGADARFAG